MRTTSRKKRSGVGRFDFNSIESVEKRNEKAETSYGRKCPEDEITIKIQGITMIYVNVGRTTAQEAGKKRICHFQLELMSSGRNLKSFRLPIADSTDFHFIDVDFFVEN